MRDPRPAAALLVVALAVTAGCAGAPAAETPSGSISVTVTNEDDTAHPAGLTVRENGTVRTELRADAVQPGSSVRFESNETGRNFTVSIESGPTGRSFEWSPAHCAHRVVTVTIEGGGSFESTDECRSRESNPAALSR